MPTRTELRKVLEAMTPEDRKATWAALERVNIDLSEGDQQLTGTKPYGFVLEGRSYREEHYRDIFLKVCEIAAAKNPDKHHLFLEITGRKRQYFSANYNDLSSSDYRKINGTKIYAELNENATTLKKRSEQVIIKFGMDPTTFSIT